MCVLFRARVRCDAAPIDGAAAKEVPRGDALPEARGDALLAGRVDALLAGRGDAGSDWRSAALPSGRSDAPRLGTHSGFQSLRRW